MQISRYFYIWLPKISQSAKISICSSIYLVCVNINLLQYNIIYVNMYVLDAE